MLRLYVCACVLVIAACGVTDDRPRNLEAITAAILRPQCAAAPCHSAFRQWVGDEYDTVATARTTLVGFSLLPIAPGGSCRPHPGPCNTDLITTLTVGLTSYVDASRGRIRMPYDAPIATADLALIQDWIADGWDLSNPVTLGQGPSGAQCDPVVGARTCGVDSNVYACRSDGNLGALLETCTNKCAAGACLP